MAGSTTELIKEKLDVVQFLQGYVKIAPAGRNFRALCPFHKEKTPSFMVSPERQSWHCFGCGLGGDVFTFLMRYENLEFGEALRVLAERAGIELQQIQSADYKYTNLLYELNEKAREFFERELQNSNAARKYLDDRKLAKETIEEFELGFAPQSAESLTLHLLNAGYGPDDMIRAGLTIKTERGLKLDRFRGRIMFPIHNSFGKVVGFTGRVLPEFDDGKMGKYVNSPETPIFNKSKLLYGFWKSKNFIREAGNAFLVEGQMDFLMSWQAGVKNAVATSGTALTPDHLRALRRLTEEIVLSFDTDEAGFSAGERAIDLAEAADFNVKVAISGDFKDPAEVAEKDSALLKKIIVNAKPAMEFYFERYLPKNALLGRVTREYLKSLRAVLLKIKAIASPVNQSFWQKELSRRSGVDEGVLKEESEKLKIAAASSFGKEEEPETPKTDFSRRELLSQRLLAYCAAMNDFAPLDGSYAHMPPEYQKIFEAMKNGKRATGDNGLDELVGIIEFQHEFAKQESFDELKRFLSDEYVKERRRELTAAVREAELHGDENSIHEALQKFSSHLYEEK